MFSKNKLTYPSPLKYNILDISIDIRIRSLYNVCIMSSVLLTVKTDRDTKAKLKSFAEELGVTSSALVNLVVKQALRDKRLVLTTELEPTPYLEKIMYEAEKDYKAGRNISGPFKTVDEMFVELEK